MSRARDLAKLGNTNIIAADSDFNVGLGTTASIQYKLDVIGDANFTGVVTATSFGGDGSALTGVAATDNINTNNIAISGIATVGTSITMRESAINVTGVITATSFSGDGSSLTGLPGGLGTAIAASGGGANIYYANKVLAIDTNLTTDVPDTSNIAYTQHQDLAVGSGAELVVSDGDQIVTDILGLSTDLGSSALTGGGGVVRADNFTNRTGGAPTFPDGIKVSAGVVTVSDTTASTTTSTGALVVSGGVGIAGSLHVGENVSIGGTLTYEDVTNIDSVGIVTAQTGVRVTAGGLVVTAGVSTLAADLSIADKIVHTGDTNTALRFPSADTITAETGGSERLRITSTGFVGVNENTPACQFHVEQDVDHASTFWLNSDAGIMIANKNSTANTPKRVLKLEGDAAIVYGSTGTGDLLFNQRENTVLTLAESRQVGIGITNPGAELHTYHATSNTIAQFESGDAGAGVIWKDNSTYSSIEQNGTDFIISADNGGNHASSALVFKVDGAERARITSGGLVGINTDSPGTNHNLEILGNAGAYATINLKTQSLGHGSSLELGAVDDDDYGRITQYASAAGGDYNGRMSFYAGGTETMHLVGGRLLVGHTASEALGYTGSIQVQGVNSSQSAITVKSNQNDSGGPAVVLAKSRGALGGTTVVQLGDQLGSIYFNGADGTDSITHAAEVRGSCDDTPGSNDMPGRLTFLTTNNGQATVTERLRIDSRGSFVFSNGALLEKVEITAGKLSDNATIDLADGMVHYFTTQETTTSTPNIRVSSAVTLNDIMTAGDVITVTLITTAAAGGYSANVQIDGANVTEEWVGGSAPSEGGSDGLDIYVYTIICIHASNTGNSGFKVIANNVNASN